MTSRIDAESPDGTPGKIDEGAARLAFWLGFPLVLGLFSGWNQIGMIAPSLPLGWSVVYWLLLSAIMWAGLGIGTLIIRKLAPVWPAAAVLVTGALLGVALTRPFHALFQSLFVPLTTSPSAVRTLVVFPATLADWGLLYSGNAMLIAFWVGGGLFFARFLGYAPLAGTGVAGTARAPLMASRAPLLAARLARLDFADVDVVRAEDHYCRLFAKGGEELVLHRFADAVIELAPLGWTRVHRSYCVRDSAVVEHGTRGRTLELVMQSSQRVPVSERYRAVVDMLAR